MEPVMFAVALQMLIDDACVVLQSGAAVGDIVGTWPMAFIVMAYIVMAYIVMAYIVMA